MSMLTLIIRFFRAETVVSVPFSLLIGTYRTYTVLVKTVRATLSFLGSKLLWPASLSSVFSVIQSRVRSLRGLRGKH